MDTDRPPAYPLRDVPELQTIRGVPFAAGITFRQVVVTGPPGSGKTTLVSKIAGWPDEGFIDLTQRNWWRSRILAFRPRQIHLGVPFEGHAVALTMFEHEWLDPPDRPVLDLARIMLPPLGRRRNPWKWRHKYGFEFLLPPAEKVFEARKARSDRRSHVIDAGVTIDRVREQLDVYWRVARHFHRAGMRVYVRNDFDAPPRLIDEPVDDEAIAAVRERGAGPAARSWLHHYFHQFTNAAGDRIADRSRRAHLAGSRATVARSVLPIEVIAGPRKLRVYDERIPPALAERWPQSVRIVDPDSYFSRISDFVRLSAGESKRFGPTDREAAEATEGSFARLEIANDGDFIAVTDLESPTGTVVAPLEDPVEIDRLFRERDERIARLRNIIGGLPPEPDPAAATALLERAIAAIERNPWRPSDSRGRPGGLVELPPAVVPVIIGDLHANLDNLLVILSEGRFLDTLERGEAVFILLGDAVHPEEGADLREMDSSIAIMDTIIALIARFGERFIYVGGNHDSFSADVTKQGIAQGRLWKEKVEQLRGRPYLNLMKRFYEVLPHVVAGNGFVTCHAGPPMEVVTRERLIDINQYPRYVYQMTWNRIQSPRNPGGYTKRDVRSLQKALGKKKSEALIVSHNPREGEDTVVLELGGIKGHHLVYSAKEDRVSVFTRIDGRIVALTFPGRPISREARTRPAGTGS
jgi:hypothetical protein